MTEEKKQGVISKLVYHVKVLVVAIIIVMLGSFFIGKVFDCDSFNRFIMQNIWDGGINCSIN